MAAPFLLSLGSVNADFQVRVDRYPRPGETLPGRAFLRLSGGKAANVTVLARRLGVEARLLARVGDDGDLRTQALAPLEDAGIDVSMVGTAAGCDTGTAMIFVPPDGKKGIVLAGNANEAWDETATERAAEAVAQAPDGSVLVADLEIPAAVVRVVLQAAARRGMAVVLDPSPADRADDDLLGLCTAVTPNPAETAHLTGVDVEGPNTALRAARVLAGRGVALPCIKLPDGGCVMLRNRDGAALLVPPEPVEVIDSTGAGDAFAGALAVALLEGRPPVEAVCLAVAASSLAVQGYGSQPSYADRAETEAVAHRLTGRVQSL